MNSKLTKLLALALALVMVLGLFAGCGKKAEEPAPEVAPVPRQLPLPKQPPLPKQLPLPRLLPRKLLTLWSMQTTTCPRSSAPSSLTLPTTRTQSP